MVLQDHLAARVDEPHLPRHGDLRRTVVRYVNPGKDRAAGSMDFALHMNPGFAPQTKPEHISPSTRTAVGSGSGRERRPRLG